MVELSGDPYQNLRRIAQMGNYSVAPKLPEPVIPPVSNRDVSLRLPGTRYNNIPGLNLSGLVAGGLNNQSGTGGGSELDRLMRAIRSKESSGNYQAINRDSGARGAYQIMPFNILQENWDRQALGRDVSLDEFLSNRSVQDAIARYKLNQYLQKYGAPGAAVAWYGGEGSVKNMYSKSPQAGGYPSLYAYWQDVLSKM